MAGLDRTRAEPSWFFPVVWQELARTVARVCPPVALQLCPCWTELTHPLQVGLVINFALAMCCFPFLAPVRRPSHLCHTLPPNHPGTLRLSSTFTSLLGSLSSSLLYFDFKSDAAGSEPPQPSNATAVTSNANGRYAN